MAGPGPSGPIAVRQVSHSQESSGVFDQNAPAANSCLQPPHCCTLCGHALYRHDRDKNEGTVLQTTRERRNTARAVGRPEDFED